MGNEGPTPRSYMWLSIAAAVATIVLKLVAWQLTDSVGLMSDALESFVNLAGAAFGLWMVTIAHHPPDAEHPFGHGKAEYFSAGVEGLLIFGAAVAIIVSSIERLVARAPLQPLDLGLALSTGASLVNLAVARTLARAARRHRSTALMADSRHLMTDVWTSAGVIVGLAIAGLTGLDWLDPVLALLVAANIAREAVRLVREAADGLLDRALPPDELASVQAVLDRFAPRGAVFAHVRTRHAGSQSFLAADLLVPRDWNIVRAHDLADEVEAALREALPHLTATLHIEPQPARPA